MTHKKSQNTSPRRYPPKKPQTKSSTPMKKLSTNLSIPGSKFSGTHVFSCGASVPIYEICSIHALNQIIGYSKFINRSYGDVYYRGECKLHNSMKPSLFRNCTNTSQTFARLKRIITGIAEDNRMQNELKIDAKDPSLNLITKVHTQL